MVENSGWRFKNLSHSLQCLVLVLFSVFYFIVCSCFSYGVLWLQVAMLMCHGVLNLSSVALQLLWWCCCSSKIVFELLSSCGSYSSFFLAKRQLLFFLCVLGDRNCLYNLIRHYSWPFMISSFFSYKQYRGSSRRG